MYSCAHIWVWICILVCMCAHIWACVQLCTYMHICVCQCVHTPLCTQVHLCVWVSVNALIGVYACVYICSVFDKLRGFSVKNQDHCCRLRQKLFAVLSTEIPGFGSHQGRCPKSSSLLLSGTTLLKCYRRQQNIFVPGSGGLTGSVSPRTWTVLVNCFWAHEIGCFGPSEMPVYPHFFGGCQEQAFPLWPCAASSVL